MNKKEHHILSLSGGKDSTALAFFIKDNMPELFKKIELVFADTEYEIPETYDYLNKIEVFLNKKITRLKPQRSFEHILLTNKFLPSHYRRWCTGLLKNQTFERYIKNNYSNFEIYLYIGIRADEAERAKAANRKQILKEKFPFIENNINKQDVENILVESGIGYPDYYKWRKRSGCYFCFYQSCNDWINLWEHHPDLYKKAMSFEFTNCKEIKSGRMGFNMHYSLEDMIKPKNIKKIKEEYKQLKEKQNKNKILKTGYLINEF